MKILQVALGVQHDIRNAFSKLGEVVYYDWAGRDHHFNSDLKALADQHKPNLIWLQIQTQGIIAPALAAELSRTAIVVNWTGDVRSPLPRWFVEVGKNIHLTLFTNMTDVDEIRNVGVKADYLQIGFPEKIFTPNGEKRQEAEIVFMGNNTGGFPLSGFRKDMVNSLIARYGNRFKVYGINWPGYHPEYNQHEEAKIYRGCKIAINCSHFNYSRYSSDRLYRLMGAGAFCLSHNYKDINTEFTPGVHLDVWNNVDELFAKIDYYLQRNEERMHIAKTGCDLVHKECTWDKRIEQLMQMLK